MNKKNKAIALAALAAAVAVLFAVYLIVKNADTEPTETSLGKLLLLVDEDYRDAVAITVARGEQRLEFAISDGGWVLGGDASLPLKNELVEAMAEVISEVAADKYIETGDSGEYGFDEPEFVLTAEYKDGDKYEYIIGDLNSFTGQRYLKTAWNGAVYLVDESMMLFFDYDTDELMELDTRPSDLLTGIVQSVTVKSEGKENVISDERGTAALFTEMKKLDFKKCTDYFADADELAVYGITGGAAVTVKYKTTGSSETVKSFTLILGARTADGDGFYYAIPDGTIIYQADYLIYSTVMSYLTYKPE